MLGLAVTVTILQFKSVSSSLHASSCSRLPYFAEACGDLQELAWPTVFLSRRLMPLISVSKWEK
jgi:hypothetical protein